VTHKNVTIAASTFANELMIDVCPSLRVSTIKAAFALADYYELSNQSAALRSKTWDGFCSAQIEESIVKNDGFDAPFDLQRFEETAAAKELLLKDSAKLAIKRIDVSMLDSMIGDNAALIAHHILNVRDDQNRILGSIRKNRRLKQERYEESCARTL
jgi:hypothetical protein